MFARVFGLGLLITCLVAASSAEAQRFQRRGSNYRPQQYNPPQTISPPSQPTPAGTNTSANSGLNLHWSQQLLVEVERDHDFGVVAKASTQRHVFEFTNTMDSELRLSNPRVSCGCTKVQILTPTVQPGEVGQIEAVLDTRNFVGQRGATVTVGCQRSSPANDYSELRFSVKGMIRTDVVFDPGIVNFGEVMQGKPAVRKVIVKYAGNPNWAVQSVTSSDPDVDASIVELSRDPASRRVAYEVTVTLKEGHLEGLLNDQLTLKTNDASHSQIVLPMTGRIDKPISVADLNLGLVPQGETLTKKLIVTGKEPFEIISVKSSNPNLKFTPDSGLKTLHIISYQFDAQSEGLVKDKILIQTSSALQPELTVNLDAQVVAETIVNGKRD